MTNPTTTGASELTREWAETILELCRKDDPNTVVDSKYVAALCEHYLRTTDEAREEGVTDAMFFQLLLDANREAGRVPNMTNAAGWIDCIGFIRNRHQEMQSTPSAAHVSNERTTAGEDFERKIAAALLDENQVLTFMLRGTVAVPNLNALVQRFPEKYTQPAPAVSEGDMREAAQSMHDDIFDTASPEYKT